MLSGASAHYGVLKTTTAIRYEIPAKSRGRKLLFLNESPGR